MKNLLQTIRATFLLILLLGSGLTVAAYDFASGGIYYNITSSTNMTVAVTYDSKTNNTYSGTVTIPEKVTHNGNTYYVTAIGDYAFVGCTGLKGVNITSERTKTIGNYAFQGCNGLTSFVIPPQITSIGNYVFSGCLEMTGLTIEEGDETLSLGYNSSSKGLFSDCPLTSVFIGRPLGYSTSSGYGYSPFANNKNIVEVRLGKKLTSIRNYMFYGCTHIDEVTCCAVAPPTANANCFANYNATLYVPKGSVNSYRNAAVWKDFYSIIGIDIVDDKPGDVDGNDKVNIDDVTSLINYILNSIASGINTTNADVDGNGKVNIDDVTALIQLLLTGHL